MQSSHSLDRLSVQFEDKHLVANAGLILPGTLAQHLDLAGLLTRHVDIGVGNVAAKAMTVVHTALAGGSWVCQLHVAPFDALIWPHPWPVQ